MRKTFYAVYCVFLRNALRNELPRLTMSGTLKWSTIHFSLN